MNLTTDTDWLQIENEIKMLGVYLTTRFTQTVERNWSTVLTKFRRSLWMNNVRKLNLVQKTILINTYVSSKLWYIASVLPLPNKYAGKFISQIGSFLWYGRATIRVAFETIILPKGRGGLNLHSPALKARALLVNRMVQMAESLTFFLEFYRLNDNPPFVNSIPQKFQHMRIALQESAFLPAEIMGSLTSCSIYIFFLKRLKDAKIVRQDPIREWKAVFKNLHSKHLSSNLRSTWYIVMHQKIATNELLYQQQRRQDPFCDRCPNEVDTVSHTIFKCGINRRIWHHQRELLIRCDRRLISLGPTDWIYPTMKQIRRTHRIEILKTFAVFLCYISETKETDRSIDHFEFFKKCN